MISPLSGQPTSLTPARTGFNSEPHRQPSPGPSLQQQQANKKAKVRWHFGIRSRSEPLEVMLEIYKVLKTLGFEWKQKTPEQAFVMDDPLEEMGDHSIYGAHRQGSNDGSQYAHHAAGQPAEDPKKRKRREEDEFTKKSQALFFIETRCRLDDVMVRMDLQLYKIDAENYLVDFRNLGYKLIRPSHHRQPARNRTGVSFADESASPHDTADDGGPTQEPGPAQHEHVFSLPQSGSVTAGTVTPISALSQPQANTSRQLWEAAAKARAVASGGSSGPSGSLGRHAQSSSHHRNSAKEAAGPPKRRNASSAADGGSVSSPFLFLECACKLIVELGKFGEICRRNSLTISVLIAVGSG